MPGALTTAADGQKLIWTSFGLEHWSSEKFHFITTILIEGKVIFWATIALVHIRTLLQVSCVDTTSSQIQYSLQTREQVWLDTIINSPQFTLCFFLLPTGSWPTSEDNVQTPREQYRMGIQLSKAKLLLRLLTYFFQSGLWGFINSMADGKTTAAARSHWHLSLGCLMGNLQLHNSLDRRR